MERKDFMERKDEGIRRSGKHAESTGISVKSILGGVALLGLATLVVVALPDIKRYIKISTM
jgi:hypothetical protein